jgi:hypothetical protein
MECGKVPAGDQPFTRWPGSPVWEAPGELMWDEREGASQRLMPHLGWETGCQLTGGTHSPLGFAQMSSQMNSHTN